MYKGKVKKRTSLLVIIAFLVSIISIPQGTVNAASFNYGEALQKAIFFYEFNRSGKLPPTNRINWRGDSGLTDGSDVGVDLVGGLYDAGDHIKFNLPMAYTATMLCWSVYESRDSLEKSGQLTYLTETIKWITDYLIKCHPSPNVYYHQVGNIGLDHKWWGPAEVMQMERPAYKLDTEHPGSTVSGEGAAALAAAALIFKDTDPTYSATCLRHAKELFNFADTTRSDKGYTQAANCYDSSSGFIDELTWASIWIYMASGDKTYLDKAESYEPLWQRENQSTMLKFTWGQCWDDKTAGCYLLLARLTGKPLYKEYIEKHLDFWTVGVPVGGQVKRVSYTAKGLAWLFQWGSLRHATTTAFLASVYADWSECTQSKVKVYQDFAKSQIDYCLGSAGRSYVTGFGVNPPQHVHHRTAQGSWFDQMTVPDYHRHTLIGALVGGPESADDSNYNDKVNDYESNEVACDYNAGFVGALAKMYEKYGGTPIPNLKAIEPVTEDEMYVEAALNNTSSSHVEIRAFVINKSAWPARVGDKLSIRYFMDLTEVFNAGYKLSDLVLKTGYSQGGNALGIEPWDVKNNIYYVNVDFTGTKIYPGGQSAYKNEVQFRISAPEATKFWDNNNDYSFEGLGTSPDAAVKTSRICLYDNGVKVFGEEPKGGSVTSPSPSVPSSPSTSPSQQVSPSPTSNSIFDLNGDGAINISDVMILATSFNTARGQAKYTQTSDLNNDGAINIADVMMIAAKFNTKV